MAMHVQQLQEAKPAALAEDGVIAIIARVLNAAREGWNPVLLVNVKD